METATQRRNTDGLRKGSLPTPISPEQEATIRSMWAAGAYRDEIARAAGITIDVFIGAQSRLGLPPRKRGPRKGSQPASRDPSPEEIAAACAVFQRGWSDEEREARLGLRNPDTLEKLPRSRGLRVVSADSLPGILHE
jgi:hypothetical protein